MSTRSAHLLLRFAESVDVSMKDGAFRKLAGGGTVYVPGGLAQEIACWARGYREFLAHRESREAGERRAKEKAAQVREALRDEEALARVLELAADAERGADARDLADRLARAGYFKGAE